MVSREEVYVAIDGERDYQEQCWNADTTDSGGLHETAAFLLYMEEYLARARKLSASLAVGAVDENGEQDLDFVRKVTALGIVCMEQNGAPKRLGPNDYATVMEDNMRLLWAGQLRLRDRGIRKWKTHLVRTPRPSRLLRSSPTTT